MTTRNEDIERLYTLFGQKTDLTRSIIANVLDGENGDFDKALEVLSKMTSDVTGTSNQNQKQGICFLGSILNKSEKGKEKEFKTFFQLKKNAIYQSIKCIF
jgi:hypothetical protein